MLRSMSDMIGYGVQATDGEIGSIQDLYVDDRTWAIRYFVVEPGTWLSDREVLISPAAVHTPEDRAFDQEAGLDWSTESIPVALTRQQVKASPDTATELPVSRQVEEDLADYYEWSRYWEPGQAAAAPEAEPPVEPEPDPYLLSVRDFTGCRARTPDTDVGEVTDGIAETDLWVVRYLVIDATTGAPGKTLLVSPNWIDRIDAEGGSLTLDLAAEPMATSPEYDPTEPIDRDFEARLHEHYDRAPYWSEETPLSYER